MATHAARRPRRRRWWLVGLAVGLGLVLITGAWLAVTGLLAAREARTLNASLTELEAAATSLDVTQMAQSLPAARASAHRINQLTSGPPWWLAERVPGVGASVRSGRAVAGTLDDLLTASAPLQPALDAVADGQLRTSEGGLNLDLVTGSISGLRDTAAAIPVAVDRLATIDTSTLPPQVGAAVEVANTQLPSLVPLLTGAADTAERIPPLLGADGPRTWLVLLMNPSEARGAGGFIGGYALITADRGKLTLTHAGANSELVEHQPIDYSALPQDTQDLWGRDLAEWQSINLSPHFPYTGKLAVQGMKQMGEQVDGVIAVDPQVVAWILGATSPVTVGGRTITADTAADYVTRQVYIDNPDNAVKDAALLSLFSQSLGNLTSGSVDLKKLAAGFGPLVDGHHLQVYSTRPAEQAWLETTPAGGVIDEELGPHVVVALNNGAGNKVDAYVQTTASYAAGNCNKVANQNSSVTLTLANEAPAIAPEYVVGHDAKVAIPRGGARTLVAVYGPVGSLLMQADLDGAPAEVGNGVDRGRPVWTFVVDVESGQSSSLTLGFTEPSGDNRTPSLRLPAQVNAPIVSAHLLSNCSAP